MLQSPDSEPHNRASPPIFRPSIQIVADSGPAIGFGHVGRCLALCEALGPEGIIAVEDGTAHAFLESRRVPVGEAPDTSVVVLDMRFPTRVSVVRQLQDAGRKVCLLDDLGDGRMAADLVIDPPTAASWPTAGGRRLGGFDHVLLRGDILALRRSRSAEGLFLSMGGSDPAGLTAPLARALEAFDPTVALGPGYQGDRPHEDRLLASQADWPAALARCDLFVTGYGHSLLEAASLGVPAVSVVFLHDHLQHARAFCENGTAAMIDMIDGPRPDELAALVTELLADDRRREAMGLRGRELVDGRGPQRVATALRELA